MRNMRNLRNLRNLRIFCLSFYITILFLPYSLVHGQFNSWIKGITEVTGKSVAPHWRDNENYEIILNEIAKGLDKRSELSSKYESMTSPTIPAKDQNEMEFHLKRALNILYHQQKEYPTQKQRFNEFLENLRSAIKTPYAQSQLYYRESSSPSMTILQDLVKSIYNDVNITQYANDLVTKMGKKGNIQIDWPQLPEENESLKDEMIKGDIGDIHRIDPVERGRKRLHYLERGLNLIAPLMKGIESADHSVKTSFLDKSIKSLRGALSFIEFDPHMEGSLVSVKYQARRENEMEPLLCLRMGTATIGSDCNTQITPEFAAYMAILRKEGKKHTYINLQNGQPPKGLKKAGIENETFRVQCLQNFSENEHLRDTLRVITLAKNSDFYWQKGEEFGSETMDGTQFLARFESLLFDEEDSGFYFPRNWRPKDSIERQEIRSILEQIYQHLYSKEKTLTRADRLNFIEYAYNLISHYAARDSFSCNKTCKDGIDRAGAANAFDHFFLSVFEAFSDRTSNKEYNANLRSLGGMIFSDALMVRHREIKKERLERFKNVAQDFLAKIKERPSLLAKISRLTPFTGVVLNLKMDQEVTDPEMN